MRKASIALCTRGTNLGLLFTEGSNMGAHVYFKLSNILIKINHMGGAVYISFYSIEIYEFKKTRTRMLDNVYHI